MWSTLVSFLCSPFFLRFLSSSDQPTGVIGNSPGVNDSRICRINSTTALFYPHPEPQLRGCHAPEERGPCGENMILYETEDGDDKTVGECDCDRKSLRTLIYHEETHRCYPIFQQGYCSQGKWLDLTPKGMPVCQQNPCYETSTNSPESTEDLVLMNGKCVKVGSSLECSAQKVVGFKGNRRTPTCIPNLANNVRSIGAPQLKCRPGTVRAISNHCQPRFQFEWWFRFRMIYWILWTIWNSHKFCIICHWCGLDFSYVSMPKRVLWITLKI